jgi:beta-N-acetylhexosaminidase
VATRNGRKTEAKPMGASIQHPRGRWTGAVAVAVLVLVLLAACAPATSNVTTRTPIVPPPAATATPDAAAQAQRLAQAQLDLANTLIRRMTLDQEFGQLFIVEYLYTDPNHSDLPEMIGRLNAGGVILYHSLNIVGIQQTRQLTAALQAQASIPLILGIDEEGGGDDQIDHIFGPHPTNSEIGATGEPQVAAQAAARIAGELKQLGLNADFAPVVDVLAPGHVWTRSFGRSPDLVSAMGAAQVDALQSAGVMACPKHFPGLGASTVNPHLGLPVIESSRDQIERVDLAPYRALLAHHPAMIMTTDLLMPAFDAALPAELSPAIVTGILRQEIGYDGVIVTDALYMGGITQTYSMSEAGVLSILAGNDMLEGPSTAREMQSMVNALHAAVVSGRIPKARIDESVRRILLLKARYGLLPVTLAPPHEPSGS